MNPYENNFLKIKLRGHGFLSEQIEYDVYLEGIEQLPGIDVTLNWKSQDLVASNGLFYTDSNALEIMRRQSDNYA